jgi:hypothetical protein
VVDRTRASISSEVPGGERRRQARNAANPFRYRDATSPELFCGESRRGGAKPRGRNERAGWNRLADGGGNTCREWTQSSMSDEGRIHTTNLTRGKCQRGGQPHPRRFGPIRAALETRPSARGAHERGKTLRTRLETGKVERGAAESNPPLPSSWPEPTTFERSWKDRRTLKYRYNVTRAATTGQLRLFWGEPDRQREPLKRRPIG